MKFLNNYKEHSYALMRIVTDYLFLWHGTQKFFDFPKEWPRGTRSATQFGTQQILAIVPWQHCRLIKEKIHV